MADRRYYPYVPWDDEPISGVVINHNTVHSDSIPRNGIYGPDQTFVFLVPRDLLKLVTQDHKVIGTAA